MPDFLGKLKTPRLAAAPSSPVVGEMYYNTATNILYWWNGTVWVSASGGASAPGVDYIGNWAVGTAYKRGDVVRYNNVDYLAVNDSTGQTPPNALPLAVAYGTSLPGSPYDGQEAVLVDSITNPSYSWRFRYNAGSISSYKWEFIGGVAAYAAIGTDETLAVINTWSDLPTLGPDLILPRPGEYDVENGYTGYNTNPAGYSTMGISIAGTVSGLPAQVGNSANTSVSAVSRNGGMGNTSAGALLRAKYYNIFYASSHFAYRWISVRPKRVS